MADLSRQRRARDLAVTPGHLRAAAIVIVGFAIAAFAAGWATGRTGTLPEGRPSVSSVGEQDLVELLARVDSRAVAGDAMDSLTFPDTLTGVAEDPPVPTVSPETASDSLITKGPGATRPFDLVVKLPPERTVDAVALVQSLGWKAELRQEEAGGAFLVLHAGVGLAAARESLARWKEQEKAGQVAWPAEIKPQ
jgi:hypothetical protein